MELKTVQDLSDWYMTLPKVQEQKIYKRKLSAVVSLLKYFADKPLNQVEADDMERYRELRRSQDISHGTVDLEIQYLRGMYNLARIRKKIPADAMPGEFVQRKEFNPRRIITDDEFNSLLKFADNDFKDVLICAYETAMRLGEIANLTLSQVYLDIQHISGQKVSYFDLGIFDTKTGARRTVPVSARLTEILQRRMKGLKPDDYVFTNNGKKIYPALIRYKMLSVCEKAKIPYGDKNFNAKGERIGIVFHCLRHTRTTKWVEMGYSDEIIRRATGHKSLEAYRNYIKLDASVVMRLVSDNSGIKSPQSLANRLF